MEAGEAVDKRVREPTSASTWYAVSGSPITDELLEWPPDLFALTNVVLARAEAFRFALSPVEAWPPIRHHDWAHAVEEAGRRLSIRVEDRTAAMPDLVLEEWSFCGSAQTRRSSNWQRGETRECARRC